MEAKYHPIFLILYHPEYLMASFGKNFDSNEDYETAK
jgi:hypothetical protein